MMILGSPESELVLDGDKSKAIDGDKSKAIYEGLADLFGFIIEDKNWNNSSKIKY